MRRRSSAGGSLVGLMGAAVALLKSATLAVPFYSIVVWGPFLAVESFRGTMKPPQHRARRLAPFVSPSSATRWRDRFFRPLGTQSEEP